MVAKTIDFSIRNRFFVAVFSLGLVILGVRAAMELPVDAVPDVTTNQVQVNTLVPGFATEEMEKYVTFPIELALASVPKKTELRSTSKFELSAVTLTFEDDVDLYWARQIIAQQLQEAQDDLPPGAVPEMAPISTGLGEIYQFVVEASEGYEEQYSLMDLRTILDWQIKPQLRSVPGVIEVNSFGGQAKQYEVLVDPQRLLGHGLTLNDVFEGLERNNANAGGAYLERAGEQHVIRGIGLLESIDDIGNVVVKATGEASPVHIKDVATVGLGSAVRQGASTKNGEGEAVMAIVMMLKGENSRRVSRAIDERIDDVRETLPPGVQITTYHNRSELVDRTISTASRNLVEGGLVVILVVFLFILQLRAGLIVSSAIPLAMLGAMIGMRQMGLSANLMSLGAIDFGLVVDAAVITVENCIRRLSEARKRAGGPLTEDERHGVIRSACQQVLRASLYGGIIILAVYVPVLSLAGIEGRMFQPMGITVVMALATALVLSFTLVPALCAIFLKDTEERPNPVLAAAGNFYGRTLDWVMMHKPAVLAGGLVFLLGCLALFPRLGSEFLPELDEGGIAMNAQYLPSISLSQSIETTLTAERLLKEFDEVDVVVSRIGRPEIATDPMGVNHLDMYAFLRPKEEWTNAKTHEELVEKIAHRMEEIPGMVTSFSQPIQFRMMELIEGAGSRLDVVVKIFGEDLDTLSAVADEAAGIIGSIPGAVDLKVQQVTGLPVLSVRVRQDQIARYGIAVDDVNAVVQTAIAGTSAGQILEGFRRFDLVVRLDPRFRNSAERIGKLRVTAPDGAQIPLEQLAYIDQVEGPMEISREDAQRYTTVQVNVRGRDIGSFVAEAQARIASELELPVGYGATWGGMWRHLESGRNRLMVVVPIVFLIVLLLLFTTFGQFRAALMVFSGVPFAITGGILALLLRDMSFSMSAGVGFIAVSGVAVLNGVVMVTFILRLHEEGTPLVEAIVAGAKARLRPVLMTAAVASVGFLPMALSRSAGAEVQRPLATVVIGGLLTSTILTLVILPALLALGQRQSGSSAELNAPPVE